MTLKQLITDPGLTLPKTVTTTDGARYVLREQTPNGDYIGYAEITGNGFACSQDVDLFDSVE